MEIYHLEKQEKYFTCKQLQLFSKVIFLYFIYIQTSHM